MKIEDSLDMFSMGARDFIVKPSSYPEIIAIIEQIFLGVRLSVYNPN